MYRCIESGPRNDLLAQFPPGVLNALGDRIQLVELKTGDTLFQAGDELRHAFFPASAVVSLFSALTSGVGAEVAVVGREGVVGVGTFLGAGKAMTSAVVQHPGMAWRIKAADLAEMARDMEAVRHMLLRYVQVLVTIVAQASACRSHHTMFAQMCRWLLQHLDRQDKDEMYVTQERIAGMLGVRRESVTAGALRLQREGLIQYQRGLIKVLDRPGIEDHSCECYAVMNTAFDQLRNPENPGKAAPRATPEQTLRKPVLKQAPTLSPVH